MTTGEILRVIRAAGLTIRVQDASIIASPKAKMTDYLRSLIRENKSALLDALTAHRGTDVALVAEAAQREPSKDDDYTIDDLAELDLLIRRLARLEGWTATELESCLDERRRMAPANVMQTLRTLREAHRSVPKANQQRTQPLLCRLAPSHSRNS